jgi:hypothetical protein
MSSMLPEDVQPDAVQVEPDAAEVVVALSAERRNSQRYANHRCCTGLKLAVCFIGE